MMLRVALSTKSPFIIPKFVSVPQGISASNIKVPKKAREHQAVGESSRNLRSCSSCQKAILFAARSMPCVKLQIVKLTVLEYATVRNVNPLTLIGNNYHNISKLPFARQNNNSPITVPRRVTLRPKYTSPVTVRWSSSMILGIFLKRFWNC